MVREVPCKEDFNDRKYKRVRMLGREGEGMILRNKVLLPSLNARLTVIFSLSSLISLTPCQDSGSKSDLK